jgi:hypothetical protein
MNAKRLENGRLLVPRRAEGPHGLIGDAMVEIGPDDPDFAAWDKWLRAEELEGNPAPTPPKKGGRQ